MIINLVKLNGNRKTKYCLLMLIYSRFMVLEFIGSLSNLYCKITLPRLGSRVQIPSSAPGISRVQRFSLNPFIFSLHRIYTNQRKAEARRPAFAYASCAGHSCNEGDPDPESSSKLHTVKQTPSATKPFWQYLLNNAPNLRHVLAVDACLQARDLI